MTCELYLILYLDLHPHFWGQLWVQYLAQGLWDQTTNPLING